MDYEEIKKLIDDMGNAKIDELEIEFPEGMKISMKKNTEKNENKKLVWKNLILLIYLYLTTSVNP